MTTQRTKRAKRTPGKTRGAEPGLRAAQASLRKEQLLSVALQLFSEQGYAGTTTKQIAAAAGVTEGLVFHHFGSKEAILLQLGTRSSTFAGKVLALVERGGAPTARGLLASVAQAYSEVGGDERRFLLFAAAESQVNPLLRAPVLAGHAVMNQRFAAILSGHVARGELRGDVDLSAAVTGFFGGFSFFFAQHRDLSDAAWRARATEFGEAWAEICWRGLASASSLSAHFKKEGR